MEMAGPQPPGPLHLHLPAGVGAFVPGTAVAFGAAVLFAVGSVLQHEAAIRCRTDRGLDLRRLVRQPLYLAGQSSTVLATVLQVVALGLAPVSIVQPMLAAALVVALGVRSVWERCLPSGGELLGGLCTVGGLAVFLVAARPRQGVLHRVPHPLVVLLAVVVAVLVVVVAARVPHGPAGALACGSAAGFAAGTAAVLISSALKILKQSGIGAAFTSAPLWAALVVAVVAQVGSQQAYSRGPLSWSLPALTVVDPLAAVPSARLLLGERLEPGHAAVWLPAAAVAALGVVLLARTGEDCRRPLRWRQRSPSGRLGKETSTRSVSGSAKRSRSA